jgi:hypothetical protein
MELHCQLDAEAVRKLALRLYGEQALKADPARVVFATVSWIDRVLDNSEAPLPVQNATDGLGIVCRLFSARAAHSPAVCASWFADTLLVSRLQMASAVGFCAPISAQH